MKYVEDLKPGTNADIGPKDIFEMTSTYGRTFIGQCRSAPYQLCETMNKRKYYSIALLLILKDEENAFISAFVELEYLPNKLVLLLL